MATINASGVISSTRRRRRLQLYDYPDERQLEQRRHRHVLVRLGPWRGFPRHQADLRQPAPRLDGQHHQHGAGDGFAIQFLANSPANDVQPGSSLNFSFTSADSPTSVNGNSVFFPGTPVGTAFVYPQGPFSDAGHQFVVTPSQTPTPTPTRTPPRRPRPRLTPTPTPTPAATPPVTVVGVQEVKNKKHLVTEIVVDFSGPVDAAQADNVANFHLATANGKGSFAAKNSPVMKLRSAAFNPANDTVTLVPKRAFALTKPLQLTINGTPPSGLEDSSGQLIDGDDNGMAGGNAVVVIRRTGVTLNAGAPAAPVVSSISPPRHNPRPGPVGLSYFRTPLLTPCWIAVKE